MTNPLGQKYFTQLSMSIRFSTKEREAMELMEWFLRHRKQQAQELIRQTWDKDDDDE